MKEIQYTVVRMVIGIGGEKNRSRHRPQMQALLMKIRLKHRDGWQKQDQVKWPNDTGVGEVGALSRAIKWPKFLCGGDATSSSNFLW